MKRLLVALYETVEGDRKSRYLACSEQKRSSEDAPWQSALKGITIRKSERDDIVAALQSADFDAKEDTGKLTNQSYADSFFQLPSPSTCTCSYTWCLRCQSK